MKKRIVSFTIASALTLGTFGGAFAEMHDGEVKTSSPYIDGYEDGTFKPANKVKRAEISKMVASLEDLEEEPSAFEDAKSHWASGFIGAVEEAEIVKGYPDGTFRPENGISRAEMATILSRLIGESAGSGNAELSDIEGHWAEDDIMNAVKAGIVKGYPDGTFNPEREVTRAEAVKMLNGVLGILSVDESITELVENPFTDISGYWAEDDILAASTDYKYAVEDGKLTVLEQMSVQSVSVLESDRNTVSVKFDNSVEEAAATDLANYAIEGAVISEAILVSNYSTAEVRLTIAEDSVSESGDHDVTISGVKDRSGVEMKSYKGSVSLIENIRPVASSAKLILNDENSAKMEVKFSKVMDSITIDELYDIPDFRVYIDGVETPVLFESPEGFDPEDISTFVFETDSFIFTIRPLTPDEEADSEITITAIENNDVADINGNMLKMSEAIVVEK